MPTQTDEETPLLQEDNGNTRPTPVPWFQFSLVLFLQLTEPLTSQVIYPFAPQVCYHAHTGGVICQVSSSSAMWG